MLFFKKKKKEEPPEIPKYNFFITIKENTIELKAVYSFEMNNTKFSEISYELLDYIMGEHIVFAIKSNMEKCQIEKYKSSAEKTSDIEFLCDEENTIIEKHTGVHSLLLKEFFVDRINDDIYLPMRDFQLKCFFEDIPMKNTIEEQKYIFNNNKCHIEAYYEDNFLECQTLIIEIDKTLFKADELIKLSIDTCRKYGKNIELIFTDEI